jgi:hypothetical protein
MSNIRAVFTAGLDAITVHGLHQWDYGQTLEIHDKTLPSLVEVHFACPGMRDAIVRPCAVVQGVATAAIPDLCLEQASPVQAWIYEIGATSGRTIRTITLPMMSRPRPALSKDIPAEVGDKYTELIGEVNRVVDSLDPDDSRLPVLTEQDNGKLLGAVGGQYALITLETAEGSEC